MYRLGRRDWLQAVSMGLFGFSSSGWLPALAEQVATDPRRRRHCILLWMSGGPSQTDTFDMKPGHENGGEFQEIATNVPGIRFSEHLPLLSKHADKLGIVRSLSTKEGDHERGTYLMRTGVPPMGASQRPSIGAALAKELASADDPMPPYVSIAPYSIFSRGAQGPGFLGPKYAPLSVVSNRAPMGPLATIETAMQPHNDNSFAELRVDGIRPLAGVSDARMTRRVELWRNLQQDFVQTHPLAAPQAHHTVYENALKLVHSGAATAFNLNEEPVEVRERYGKGVFGQGCLLARRLVERGVPFVEVSLSSTSSGVAGWDTHSDNFNAVKALSAELDAGWATLMTELNERGLLESTTIVWMGEFGRTPKINGSAGRDHFPKAWSCVLGGGGIAGGQAYGRTSPDGMKVEENAVGATDVLATVCQALGVPPSNENISETGRPLKIVEGNPIQQLLS